MGWFFRVVAHLLKKADRPVYSVCMFVRVVKKSVDHVSSALWKTKELAKRSGKRLSAVWDTPNKENTERIEQLKIIGKRISVGPFSRHS